MLFSYKKWFTLVELIVSTTILAVLTTIGFYTYTQYISDARDGVRKTDLATLNSELSLYKKQRWAYPYPWDYFELHNRWEAVAYQWYMNKNVSLSTAESIPLDPELQIPYMYSVTKNRQEHQIGLSIYNNDVPYAMVSGSYKSVSKNILPNILIASGASTAIEVNSAVGAWSTNRNWFMFNLWTHNLPYDFESGIPTTDGTTFTNLLSEVSNDYWQNSDYRSCGEIDSAGKNITISGSTDEYQILSSTWSLIDTTCTGTLAP